MTLKQAIEAIEELISKLGKELGDAAYIEALEEMEQRASDQRVARQEEIDKEV